MGGDELEPATWSNCQSEFKYADGALIDLIAPGTGEAEWEAMWAALKSGPFPLRAFRDGEPAALPESAAWVFEERKKATIRVAVQAGSVVANCHFFGGELELTIDPREVISEAAFESVLDLMRLVAKAIQRPVLAVPEGSTRAFAFLRVFADGRAEVVGRLLPHAIGVITKDEMLPLLVEACPSFSEQWRAFQEEWRDEAEGLPLYILLSDLARHLIGMVERNDTGRLPAIFAVVERWHVEGDAYVREAASVGLLEDLQNLNLHENGTEPEQFRGYLGPVSAKWWDKLIRFWEHGEVLTDD